MSDGRPSEIQNTNTDRAPDWKTNGLRIIRSGELNANTAQTPGMTRAEAISHASAGAKKLWAGTVVVHPNAKTGPHHHGELETVIYVVRGRARFRWGNNLEFVDEAGPGDFVYVPPYVPHQELNARKDQPVEAVIVRSGQEPIVVNFGYSEPRGRRGKSAGRSLPLRAEALSTVLPVFSDFAIDSDTLSHTA